jgi:DNA polymerase-1
MIRLGGSGGLLLESEEELPGIPAGGVPELFADFETSSGDPRKSSVNPWRDCQVIGAAVAFGHDSPTWFVPKRLLVTGWWRDLLRATKVWTNHNVKYDAHVSGNDLSVVPRRELELRCTLTASKLVNSDRLHPGYGLDELAKDWLGVDISAFYRELVPWLERNKDYGRVPLDVLADYACADVVTNRKLAEYLEREVPAESAGVWATERRVTSLLHRIEREGVFVDPVKLRVKQLQTLIEMVKIDEELERLAGRAFRPHVNEDCYDVLCVQYGLPVLAYTDSAMPSPSFDKHALKLYLTHPLAPKQIVEKVLRYRRLNTLNSLFLSQWESMIGSDGRMHPTYNQCVRTGRMSCGEPNMQQLSEDAKELVQPPPGEGIVSMDFSQIEFRYIVHYIGNRACVAAYQRDPWTDFHDWVADMVPTKRKPAKTINFMMGYRAGKKKTIQVLSVNEELVGATIAEVKALGLPDDQVQLAVARACERRALEVYDKYHATLPELKPTARAAETACKRRGYTRNHFGRRRHLPAHAAFAAFSTVCQSSAGDLMKERMVALDDEVPEFRQMACVHDQVLSYAPLDVLRAEHVRRRAVEVMNATSRPLTVPVRTSIGWSETSWLHAASKEREERF